MYGIHFIDDIFLPVFVSFPGKFQQRRASSVNIVKKSYSPLLRNGIWYCWYDTLVVPLCNNNDLLVSLLQI